MFGIFVLSAKITFRSIFCWRLELGFRFILSCLFIFYCVDLFLKLLKQNLYVLCKLI